MLICAQRVNNYSAPVVSLPCLLRAGTSFSLFSKKEYFPLVVCRSDAARLSNLSFHDTVTRMKARHQLVRNSSLL